ncbi:MAG: S-layer homology domain-containing protein [bacterium]|nr:S-layer homology domain-containing protein [bacterium]
MQKEKVIQVVMRRNSCWAVLAAGAVVASLIAVGSAPAAALDEDSKPDYEATSSACVGEALDDVGFEDIGYWDSEVGVFIEPLPGRDDPGPWDYPHPGVINCFAYFGISRGTSPETFSPRAAVSRRLMALYLHRAATLMGTDLTGGDTTVGFGDISDLSGESQAHILTLSRHGILAGSDSAFRPGDAITRAEMAVAVVGLLARTPGVDVAKPSTGANAGLFVLGPAPGSLPNDDFSDASESVSRSVNNAISAAYELGIMAGTPAGRDARFGPDDPVSRGDMATIITRALAHSNVRPAGVTAQVDGAVITVSVRDENFVPVANAAIDAFKISAADIRRMEHHVEGLADDRPCSRFASPVVDASTVCVIDGADPVTGSDGNVTLTLADAVGGDWRVWIWTGDLGDDETSDYFYPWAFDISVPPASAAAELRIVARELGDGRIEFGLQQRDGQDAWRGRQLPRARLFPADATVGRWLASSPLTVTTSAPDASLDRFEVRIVARRLSSGRVEFGLQQRLGSTSWGDRQLPTKRFFPADATVGRWLSSSVVVLVATKDR